MGEIVLAAKVTHVPTMLMSEQEGPVKGKRQAAIDGHREIARRAKALGATTVVICDTHWVINAGFHINANKRFSPRMNSRSSFKTCPMPTMATQSWVRPSPKLPPTGAPIRSATSSTVLSWNMAPWCPCAS